MAIGLKRYEFSERLADILGESRRDLRFRVTMLVSGGLVAPGPRGRGSPPATPAYAAKLLLGTMAAPVQAHTVEAVGCYEGLLPSDRTLDSAPHVALEPRSADRSRRYLPAIPLLTGKRTFGEVLTRLLELAMATATRQDLQRELFGIWVSRGYPVGAVQLKTWTHGERRLLTQRFELAPGARPPAWLDPNRDGNPDPGLFHTVFLPASKLVEIGELTSYPEKERPPMINFGPKMERVSKLVDLARQARFREHWEQLLETLARVQAWTEQVDKRDSRLVEVRDFGSNPGQLRMMTYVPDRLPASAPLVVLLHGCTQSGTAFDKGTGWSTLADRHGFALLLPEQHWTNNPLRCFNWFRPEDTRRDSGEALSVRQMIDRMLKDHDLDRRQVYVTGLSSGGAMTSALLATYPEVFAGGAILAGVPYRSADNMQEAFESIFQGRSRSPREWGDLVREASSHRGPWPKVSVWHGDADSAVQPLNAEEIIKQWTDVHGLSGPPHIERSVDGHPHRVWHGADGEHLVESYTIRGMSHGAPLSTGDEPHQCGTPAPFFNEVGISSAYHIARFWGLLEREMGRSTAADRREAEVIDLSRTAAGEAPAWGTSEGIRTSGDRQEEAPTAPADREADAPEHAAEHRAEKGQAGDRVEARPDSGPDPRSDFRSAGSSDPQGAAAGTESTDTQASPGDVKVGVLVDATDAGDSGKARDPGEAPYASPFGGGMPLGIDVHGIVRQSLAAAGLVKGGGTGGGSSNMPFGIDVPGIIGTSLEAASVLGRAAAKAQAQAQAQAQSRDQSQAGDKKPKGSNSTWEGEGWEILTDQPGAATGGAILHGRVSSGQDCDVGRKVRSMSRKITLGPSPELSYVRKLNLNAAVNDYTSARFSVLVDGIPVDEASAVGMEHVEDQWLQRSDIDLSRFADKTVTLTFEVAADSNVCSEVSAKAWVDRIRIKTVASCC